MTDISKPWYLSRTVLGILISVAAKALATWGYEIDPALQADLVTLILHLVGFGGDALALFGRVRATRRVTLGGGGDVAKGLMLALLLGALVAGGPVACAARVETTTSAQAVYALKADFLAAQYAALRYIESPVAAPAAVTAIRAAEGMAYAALVEAEAAAREGADPCLPALLAAADAAVARLLAELAAREILR